MRNDRNIEAHGSYAEEVARYLCLQQQARLITMPAATAHHRVARHFLLVIDVEQRLRVDSGMPREEWDRLYETIHACNADTGVLSMEQVLRQDHNEKAHNARALNVARMLQLKAEGAAITMRNDVFEFLKGHFLPVFHVHWNAVSGCGIARAERPTDQSLPSRTSHRLKRSSKLPAPSTTQSKSASIGWRRIDSGDMLRSSSAMASSSEMASLQLTRGRGRGRPTPTISTRRPTASGFGTRLLPINITSSPNATYIAFPGAREARPRRMPTLHAARCSPLCVPSSVHHYHTTSTNHSRRR